MEHRELIQVWGEIGTLLNSATAVDPGYIECMVQTSGKSGDEWLRNWWIEIRALMQGEDMKNLYRCHIHNKGMSVSEARSLAYRLRGFWRRFRKNEAYYFEVARIYKAHAA